MPVNHTEPEIDSKQFVIEEHGTKREISFTIELLPAAKVKIKLGAEEIHVTPHALFLAAQMMQNHNLKGN